MSSQGVTFEIRVSGSGKVSLDGEPTEVDSLSETLRHSEGKPKRVVVQASDRAKWEHVAVVIEAIRKAKIEVVTMAAEPSAPSERSVLKTVIVGMFERDGRVDVNGAKVTLGELNRFLEDMLTETDPKETKVFIRATKDNRAESMQQVIEAFRSHGFEDFFLQAAPSTTQEMPAE